MEIECEDGSTINLKHDGSETVFGRGSGFNTTDRTVSRRHVLFQLNKTQHQTQPRVSFQVIGKNPIWLRSGDAERKVRVFRRLEKGEMAAGDWFCVSSQTPVWFNLRRTEAGEEEDFSQIDPVKEFGFVVIGHEFDLYPKQSIRSPQNWDWFLEESKEDDDSDDDKKRKRRKRKKKGKGNDEDDEEDEEWRGQSEEDNETVAKIKKVNKSKYLTRSKGQNRPRKATERKSESETGNDEEDDEEEEDEDDDTLGGFIVDDEGDVDEEEEDESDEEEEFIDEDEVEE